MFLKYYLNRILGRKLTFAKKPDIIFIVDAYKDVPPHDIGELQSKYGIKKILILKRDDLDTFHAQEPLDIQSLPDLIIYCNNKLEFKLREPEILYKAEIVFSRFGFGERLFVEALDHYSSCVINSGK
ncbi:hypothetical protein VCUG_01385 [Vavraia culicis subsp. floridensis]|uniref:Uncharacterized protein n=1 Tax=Vavraia culicis (isolate floridensis) TaxID=948595 RepID=L2GUR2_VAVCU|nr:uncharacterized protein VCUG_01385 [Vavraia culicis subsp. floridensis]ELA47112.1 hypothetical protein VCUG_01385 [Vavraia culicis subsp. floridensis]